MTILCEASTFSNPSHLNLYDEPYVGFAKDHNFLERKDSFCDYSSEVGIRYAYKIKGIQDSPLSTLPRGEFAQRMYVNAPSGIIVAPSHELDLSFGQNTLKVPTLQNLIMALNKGIDIRHNVYEMKSIIESVGGNFWMGYTVDIEGASYHYGITMEEDFACAMQHAGELRTIFSSQTSKFEKIINEQTLDWFGGLHDRIVMLQKRTSDNYVQAIENIQSKDPQKRLIMRKKISEQLSFMATEGFLKLYNQECEEFGLTEIDDFMRAVIEGNCEANHVTINASQFDYNHQKELLAMYIMPEMIRMGKISAQWQNSFRNVEARLFPKKDVN